MKAIQMEAETVGHSLNDLKWEIRFNELRRFKKEYGHCDVPRTHIRKDYRTLAKWCSRQRALKKYKPLKFHSDRLRKLNKLGFTWQVHDANFERNLQQFKQYFDKYGNYAPSISNKSTVCLANWIIQQRKFYNSRSKYLTTERIEKLNNVIGPGWKNYSPQWRRISDNDLINELKRLYRERGLPPGTEYINKYGKYTAKTYICRFGSMAKARMAAGISPNIIYLQQYSDTELLNELKRLYMALGRVPKSKDIIRRGKYSLSLYHIRFGSYLNARKKAGLQCTRLNKIAEGDLINEYGRLYKLLGRIPKCNDITAHGKYSPNTYFRRFNSLVNVTKKAKLTKATFN